jgi:transposase
MPQTHPPYAPEYRRRISSWQARGARLQELAREFEPSANAIRKESGRPDSMNVFAVTG